MILYLVCDLKNQTSTAPAVADSLELAQDALKEINPENLDDLHIHILAELSTFLDLFLLDVNPEKKLPEFLFNRTAEVTPSASHQPEGGSDLHNL